MNKMILASIALIGLFPGCRWDEKAILGTDPADSVQAPSYGAGDSCFGGERAYVLKKDWETGGAGCASPALLESVVANGDDTLVVYVRRMTDGNFPAVGDLVYKLPDSGSNSNGLAIPLECSAGAESADGKLRANVCRPVSGWRVSSTELASSDQKLVLSSLSLKNTACGKTASYTRQWDGVNSYPCQERSDYDWSRTFLYRTETKLPDLWIESAAH